MNELEALQKQNGALRIRIESLECLLVAARTSAEKNAEAAKTIESERAANATLTEEIDALQKVAAGNAKAKIYIEDGALS